MEIWNGVGLFITLVIVLNGDNIINAQSQGKDDMKMDLRNKLDAMVVEELSVDNEKSIRHEYVSNTGIGNRETLYLSSVKEGEFNLGSGVYQWYSWSRAHKLYLLGLAENKLIAVTGSQEKVHNESFVQSETVIPAKPIIASMLDWWNATSDRTEIICVVALNSTKKDIIWYRFEDGKLEELLLSWRYYKSINFMMAVPVGLQLKLIVLSSDDNSIDIYDIKLGYSESSYKKKFFKREPYFGLSQNLHLQVPGESMAISNVGNSIYLFVSQPMLDVVLIYETATSADVKALNQFNPMGNFSCEGVKDLSSFTTAYQNYLAVSGKQPAIYKIKPNGELINDLQVNFGPVNKWIPINVETYRDDILLLVQEVNTKAVKFFTWRGIDGGFISLKFTQCDLGQTGYAGICHLNHWFGRTTNFLLGPSNSSLPVFLVPYEDGTSKMYYLKTNLQTQDTPTLFAISTIKTRKDDLESYFETQKEGVKELEIRKSFMFKTNKTNLITGNWTIGKIVTPQLTLGKNVTYKNIINSTLPSKSVYEDDNISNKIKLINQNIELIKSALDNRNDIDFRLRSFGKACGHVSIKGRIFAKSATITEKLNGTSVDDLLNDTFRLDRPKKITGKTTVRTMKADKITLNKIKDIPREYLLFNDAPVVIEGNFTLKNKLIVNGDVVLSTRGKVNGVELSKDVIQFGKKYAGTLQFDAVETMDILLNETNGINLSSIMRLPNLHEISLDHLIAGQNLTVKSVNGLDWKNLVESVIWLNKDMDLYGVVSVNGDIFTNGDMYYETTFQGENPVYSYHTHHRSAGDIPITDSSHDQDFTTETVTIKQIRCSENKDQSSLKKTSVNIIEGDLEANEVTITGTLSTLQENNDKWIVSLKDIISKKNANPIVIAGEKTFSKGLEVNSSLFISGLVSGSNVSEFLTVDSNQTVKGVEHFHKLVKFDNIIVSGNWNGINTSVFDSNSLHKSHKRMTHVHIKKGNSSKGMHDVSTGSKENIFYFDSINSSLLKVLGNITVKGQAGGRNLTQDKLLVDLTNLDIINDDVALGKASINHLSVETVNGYSLKDINEINCDQLLMAVEDVEDIKILEMEVEGNINTEEGISGYNITHINEMAIGLERNNNVEGKIIFEDELECGALDNHGFINGQPFDFTKINNDVVRKSDRSVIITGKKIFKNEVHIKDDLQLEDINGIKISQLLTKEGKQIIKGNLKSEGKLEIKDLKVTGHLNGANFTFLTSQHKFLDDNVHHWNGDINFKKPVAISNLTILDGLIKGKNFNEFASNIYTNIFEDGNQIIFSGAKRFNKNVTIYGNMEVSNNFNDHHLNTFFKDLVFVNEQATINNEVTFSDKVVFRDGLQVDHDMNVSVVYGCNLKQLYKDAIYLDASDAIEGSIVFESASSGGNIKVSSINNIDFDQIFLLTKPQTVTHTLRFDKITVRSDVPVGNLVNELKIDEEYERTLLTETDQVIDDKLFNNGNISIKGNLVLNGTINSRIIQNVVKLKGDNTFSGPFIFDCIKLNEELLMQSNILSGIDVNDWERRAVLKDNHQNISGVWDVKGSIKFNSVEANGSLNNINLLSLDNEVDLWKAKQIKLQYTVKDNYSNECSVIKEMEKEARKQLYELQNFEVSQNLLYEDVIRSFHFVKGPEENYLIISGNSSCKLSVYIWDKVDGQFKKFFEQEGFKPVKKMISVKYNNEIFMITEFAADGDKHIKECSNETGFILWKFSSKHFQFIKKLNNEDDFLITNNNGHENGTFFTQNRKCVFKWDISQNSNGKYELNKKCYSNHYNDMTSTRLLLDKIYADEHFQPLNNATSNDTIITEYTINPRNKYVAIAMIDYPELPSRTDFVKIYKSDGLLYHKIIALKPRALNWLDVPGQNWISFIENNTSLQVYELKGTDTEFINRLSLKIASFNLLTGSLPLENKLSLMPIMILQVDLNAIDIIKGNIAGDPYNGPTVDCDIKKGIS